MLTWLVPEPGPGKLSPLQVPDHRRTDSSPEEILRQAGCKQQPGEGVEHVEGSSVEAREAPRGGGG